MDEKLSDTPKNKCQYCGKEYKNASVHERFCELNPESQKANTNHKKEKDQPKESAQDQKPLIITDVQPSLTDPEIDNLPWFDYENGERKYEIPKFIGIHDNIPCVLVMTIYGRLVPPYAVPGFIGMFPKEHIFPEQKPEPQPEIEQPINTSGEPIKSPLEEEKHEQVIVQEPERKSEPIHAQGQPKKSLFARIKSLFARILGKKEKTVVQEDTSVADIAKQIINAS